MWVCLALVAGCGGLLRPAATAQGAPWAIAAPGAVSDTGNLIRNGDFSAGTAPWWSTATVALDAATGELAATISNGGANPWDALVGQNNIPLQAGLPYTVSLDIRASAPITVILKIQKEAAPYTGYYQHDLALTTTSRHLQYAFTAPLDDPAAAFQFQLGGVGNHTVFVDNVVLEGELGSAPPPSNLVSNGDWSAGLEPWWAGGAVDAVVSGVRVDIADGGANPWDAILGQNDIPLQASATYTVSFAAVQEAPASAPATVTVKLQQNGAPFSTYFARDIALTPGWQTYSYTFTAGAADPAASFQFQMGGVGAPSIGIDHVSLIGAGGELLENGDFTSSIDPWWTNGALTADRTGLCARISDGGANPWDVLVGQHDIPLEIGKTYTYTFEASATVPVTIHAVIQENGGDYIGYFGAAVPLTPALQTFDFSFTSAYSDPAASLQFQLGGLGTPTVCFNHVALAKAATGVRLNQTGYQPDAPKHATAVHPQAAPLPWELRDAADTAVLSGTTTVFGADAASGEHLHRIDFSAYATPGDGYILIVGGERSHPFAISPAIYRELKYDALAYFYHNRSGIAITLPYALDAQWARPAGHIGVAPNEGDMAVTCFSGQDLEGHNWPGCAYTLDVSKGWYDAGDQGKYVVNGGIATWTLLNQYERALAAGRSAPLADGRMNIPENHNGAPDILDEARWELEFMLGMQIPASAGISLTGMVHHKVHDAAWTGLPTAPHLDPQPRFLYPPSTAATLNLAATAAQCARIWRPIDAAFAERCLDAAAAAWAAALAHPAEYARNNFTGGGPYDDTQLDDEFYWAAAELYTTTGAAAYKDFIEASPVFLGVPTAGGSSMDWSHVGALGTISLALAPNGLSAAQVATARANVAAAADSYLAALAASGYGAPFAPGGAGRYPWGSNSAVLNNMIVLGLAADFSGDPAYAAAVAEGMDYLLGRNPMDKSYVSGYGERPLTNPHHRFWARQADEAFPPPPPGVVSGGPNSGIEDPFAQTILQGCAPQKCYVDDLQSYSTNEVTINWNAPLAWAAAFLDERTLPADTYLPLLGR